MRLLIWLFLAFPLAGMCQENGLFFQEGLSWKEILKKAQAEHKNIFVDCFATWCGPCKYMNKSIFTVAEVGKIINEGYISIEVQMDSTIEDAPAVKRWYSQAAWFKNTFRIDVYPTFLFFSSTGRPIHKIVGASQDPKEFLEKVKEVDNIDKQYFTLVDHYKERLNDSAFLAHAMIAALKANDRSDAASICDAYIDCLKTPFLKENLKLIAAVPLSTDSKAFKIFLEHPAEVDTTLGINTASDLVIRTVKREVVGPLLATDSPPVDWEKLTHNLKTKYPEQAERVVMESKLGYYAGRQMWNEYGKALVELVKNTPQMDADNLNEAAWSVFVNCNDPEVLQQAIYWSRRAIANKIEVLDATYFDTYANLLYKTSRVDEAIIWEQKALSLASAKKNTGECITFEKTIIRMKNREKIWDSPL